MATQFAAAPPFLPPVRPSSGGPRTRTAVVSTADSASALGDAMRRMEQRLSQVENDNYALRLELAKVQSQGNQDQALREQLQQLRDERARDSANMLRMRERVQMAEEQTVRMNERMNAVTTALAGQQDRARAGEYADLSRLKQVLREKATHDAATQSRSTKQSAVLFKELVRLGQNMEQMSSGVDARINAAESQMRAMLERLDRGDAVAGKQRDVSTSDVQGLLAQHRELQQQTGSWVESVRSAMHGLGNDLKVEVAKRTQLEEEHYRWLQSIREHLLRLDADGGQRLAAAMGDVGSKMLVEREMAQQAFRAQEEERIAAQAQAKQELAARIEAVVSRVSALDRKLSTELTSRVDATGQLERDVRAQVKMLREAAAREEAARSKEVRRVEESISAAVARLEKSMAETEAASRLEPLEAVVRAEIKKRMSNESSLRKRVEEVVSAMSRAMQTLRQGQEQSHEALFDRMTKAEQATRAAVERGRAENTKAVVNLQQSLMLKRSDNEVALTALRRRVEQLDGKEGDEMLQITKRVQVLEEAGAKQRRESTMQMDALKTLEAEEIENAKQIAIDVAKGLCKHLSDELDRVEVEMAEQQEKDHAESLERLEALDQAMVEAKTQRANNKADCLRSVKNEVAIKEGVTLAMGGIIAALEAEAQLAEEKRLTEAEQWITHINEKADAIQVEVTANGESIKSNAARVDEVAMANNEEAEARENADVLQSEAIALKADTTAVEEKQSALEERLGALEADLVSVKEAAAAKDADEGKGEDGEAGVKAVEAAVAALRPEVDAVREGGEANKAELETIKAQLEALVAKGAKESKEQELIWDDSVKMAKELLVTDNTTAAEAGAADGGDGARRSLISKSRSARKSIHVMEKAPNTVDPFDDI